MYCCIALGYKVTIPPHSLVAIELMGGIHHFHNIRGLSFHRLNMPANNLGNNITLNTQQWGGNLPKGFTELRPQPIHNHSLEHAGRPVVFHDLKSMQRFMHDSYGFLAQTARSPLHEEWDRHVETRPLIDHIYASAHNFCSSPATMADRALQSSDQRFKPPAR